MINRNHLPGSHIASVRGESCGTPGFCSPETKFLEETMETKHARLSVWALVLFTFFALFGGQSAFAYDNTKARAEAGGWVCKPGGTGPSGCQEVKLGLTAKTNKANVPDGRFEYMNKTTK